jgi:hypothetical protein
VKEEREEVEEEREAEEREPRATSLQRRRARR